MTVDATHEQLDDTPDTVQITIDGVQIDAQEGRPLVEVAAEHGVYIPTLCYHPGHPRIGTCRVCSVVVNGSVVASCATPVREGMDVQVQTESSTDTRRALVEMLFVEGIHNCPSCEKSGRCQLQAVAIDMELEAVRFPYRYPAREPDPGAQRIWLERDRCILCQRCVEFVRDTETGRGVFSLSGRGEHLKVEIDHELADRMTEEQITEAVNLCPVGAILRKAVGYDTPMGRRRYEVRRLRERVVGRPS